MNSKARVIMILCAGLIGLVVGCRSEDEMNMSKRREWTTGAGGQAPDWPDQGTGGPPDTHRDPPVMEVDDVPDTVPTGRDPEEYIEYATEVYIHAGCEMNPPEVAFPKAHDVQGNCEYITSIPARNDDGDFYEVGMQVIWDVLNDDILGLMCENEHCLAEGKQDIFDGESQNEPTSIVVSCAVNHCPDPRPWDCADIVCASVMVASVVNLEGTWIMDGSTFDPPLIVSPLQDGRTFSDMTIDLKKGVVHEKAVGFEIGDTLYQGAFVADRNHLQGEAWEMMTLTSVGPWSAERIGQ